MLRTVSYEPIPIRDASPAAYTHRPALGEPVPLVDVEAADRWLASMTYVESMYGWCFVDTEAFRGGWPDTPSLVVQTRRARGHRSHSLYWFAECNDGHQPPGRYLIEGVVYFDYLHVERADGTHITAQAFADDGTRWWQAFRAGEDRVNVAAQRQAGSSTPRWRPKS